MEYFMKGLRNWSDFAGKATRKDYWMFVLIYILISIAVGLLDGLMGTTILGLILSLVLLIPSISYAARRLHDTGRSGWWLLIGLIPIVGWIVIIVMLCLPTNPDSKY